jgi:AcrR family transcriptional regulator
MRVRTATKRESILKIAAQVFQEMGYERTSMDEITLRTGGSKATLYRYFPSKQELFLEVTNYLAAPHLGPAYEELKHNSLGLPAALRQFGEKFLTFICTPEAAGTYRMVLGNAGQSDIGLRFYEQGPKPAEDIVTAFLKAEMDAGHLKMSDPAIASSHLLALITSEAFHRILMGVSPPPTDQQIKQFVDRAVSVFMAAYAS